jgi:hypothetical protein
MKKLLLVLLICAAGDIVAQEFEGSITWAIKMEFSDPLKKQQMEDTHKRINDPLNRAKLTEMEGRMNETKARGGAERNPKVRKELDESTAAMQGASMFPTGLTVSVKNGSSVSKVDGVFPEHEILYQKENDQRYTVNRKMKQFSTLPKRERRNAKSDSLATVTKTNEVAKIQGYNCTKYIVEKMEGGLTSTQEIWATTEITGFDVNSIARLSVARVQWNLKRIEGVPLKLVGKNRDGVFSMEATEVKQAPQNAEQFKIPGDFRETAKRVTR